MLKGIIGKLRGLAVALVAVLAVLMLVPGTAGAAEWNGESSTASITVTNLVEGDNVTLYKIAHVRLNDDNTTTLVAENSNDQTLIDAYLGDQTTETAAALDRKGTLVDGPFNATGTSMKFDSLQAGLYYVHVEGTASDYTYQPTVVALNVTPASGNAWTINDKTVDLKKQSKILDKKVSGTTKEGDEYFAMVGDTLPFTVRFAVNADDHTLTLTDTMSKGLAYQDGSLVIKDAAGQVVNAADAYTSTWNSTTRILKIEFDSNWLDQKTPEGNSAHAGVYTAEYQAMITPDATLDGEKNSVTCSNVADHDSFVNIKFVGFKVVKYDDSNNNEQHEQNEELLPDAQFALYSDPTCSKPVYEKDGKTQVTLTTNMDGEASTNENTLLKPMTYYLKETKAPSGYKPKDSSVFKIEVGSNTDNNVFYIANVKSTSSDGFQLPTTGGAGTVAFTAVGVVIMAGAVAFIVRSRKDNE